MTTRGGDTFGVIYSGKRRRLENFMQVLSSELVFVYINLQNIFFLSYTL